ncbi:Acetyltransferase (GNAT) family protein [uncultured archaeon]|nr:Acetyltransferase (GNAT) family protein [uncultured archaeon]
MHEIRVITKGKDLLAIGPKTFKEFITPFVKEKSYLSVQKVPTLAQQRAWVAARAKEIDKKALFYVLLFSDGKLVGDCSAHLASERQSERHNVYFGLAISKSHRGMGWGEKLLRRAIVEAKKRFKPHRIWIEHTEGNLPARRLYQKVGFVEVGRLNEYHNHHGRFVDKILMQYKPNSRTKPNKR